MDSPELTETDAEAVRRFRHRPWGEWTKTVVIVVALGGPLLWARFVAPFDQGIIFLVFVVATLGLFQSRNPTPPPPPFWMYSPLWRVIRRNVLCHLGRVDIESAPEPSEASKDEGPFEKLRQKHPWAVGLSAVVLYYSFCAVYMRLAIKGTKQDIDVALVVLLLVHLVVRGIGRKTNPAHSHPSAR